GAAGDIPRLEVAFPESIHPAGRDIAQVERRRAEAPYGSSLRDKRAEEADDLLDSTVHIVRKAGDEQRIDKRTCRRHMERAAIEERAASAFRREELAAIRVVDGGDLRDAVHLEGE